MRPRASNSKVTTRVRQLTLRAPFSLLDHRDQLDLNHCLWLSETTDLDRRAGRTGYPEVAHAHVGALRGRLVVRDEGVGLDNIGPRCASGLEAGVEVLEGLFELCPHVARADDVALCVACQLAGDVDRLTGACDRDDVRIGGLPLLHADVQAGTLAPAKARGRGRDAVEFAEEAKISGLPQQAIDRAGWLFTACATGRALAPKLKHQRQHRLDHMPGGAAWTPTM